MLVMIGSEVIIGTIGEEKMDWVSKGTLKEWIKAKRILRWGAKEGQWKSMWEISQTCIKESHWEKVCKSEKVVGCVQALGEKKK